MLRWMQIKVRDAGRAEGNSHYNTATSLHDSPSLWQEEDDNLITKENFLLNELLDESQREPQSIKRQRQTVLGL